MAEWSNAHAWKACIRATVSRVRIPFSPPLVLYLLMKKGIDYIGVAAGAMVVNNQGQVLLSKRGPQARNEVGKWDFPGGAVEFGETFEQAIIREIEEEFNILIEVVEMLMLVDHILPEEGQHWVAPTYIARTVSGELKNMEPGKIDEVVWINIEDVDVSTLSVPSVANMRAYTNKYGTTVPEHFLR